MLVASTFLLWIVVILMAVAIVALARQIGVLHERIAPMGALVTDGGPKAGDVAPRLTAPALGGGDIVLGGEGERPTLMLFVAPDCPICKKIVPIAMVLSKAEALRLVFVGDGADADYTAMAAKHHMGEFEIALSGEVGIRYRIGKLPSAALIDERGVLVGKGLVNSREHLESLLVARETGYASAQAYLKDRQAAGDDKVVALAAARS